ncbi:hypothetical protein AVEN_52188-1 [Araneus ventricosus]|uniref:Uncharacterized protein n=1 Tax=Araneus ventricosus TaxID=182803 RepID=A0A4Y2NVD6_ARAVE|nr:hypothetical protein AVEN_52188-1 [Araneus ventricosus]
MLLGAPSTNGNKRFIIEEGDREKYFLIIDFFYYQTYLCGQDVLWKNDPPPTGVVTIPTRWWPWLWHPIGSCYV